MEPMIVRLPVPLNIFLPFTSKHSTRYGISGVRVSRGNGEAVIEATDGCIATRLTYPDNEEAFDVLIPGDAICLFSADDEASLSRDGDGNWTLSVGPLSCMFDPSDVRLPDISSVIPEGHAADAVAPLRQFLRPSFLAASGKLISDVHDAMGDVLDPAIVAVQLHSARAQKISCHIGAAELVCIGIAVN